MAQLEIENDQLILKLTKAEKLEAVHGDLHVSFSQIKDIEIINNALEMTDIRTGFKIGMRVPGRASVATVVRPGHKMFVVVHHDTPRAIRVTLKDNKYDEWIVGLSNPESILATLKSKQST